MRWHHRLVVALREWFRPSARDRELNEELQFHFDRQLQANLEAGMPLEQARRQAALAIGNAEPIREASRDARAGALVRQFGRDVRYGIRTLIKAPAFSISAITIVALGVASVTAIFSVVYGVVLKPLPFSQPDRLVQVWSSHPAGRDGVNAADHREWQDQNTTFDGIALINILANFNLTGAGDPERILGARISPNLLSVLGVSPLLGRNFTEEEDDVGLERVVILSHALWRSHFASDREVIGRTIALAGIPHTVVGVMGRDFVYPSREHRLWVPLTINPAELQRKVPAFGLQAVARLKHGVSIADAQSRMNVIAARQAERYPMNNGVGVEIVGMQSDLVAGVSRGLHIMLAAVGSLLIVAALNLAGLMSARGAARSREIAVRLALGASRGRVVLQMAAEIVPILTLGGVFGVVAAAWAVQAFVPFAPPTLPRVENVAVDRYVLLGSFLVLCAAGLLACILPAMQAWRVDVMTAAGGGGRGSTPVARQAFARSALVVTQIALSLPLLTAAVLLTRTFTAVASMDPGFRAEEVVSFHLAIPRSKYRDDRRIAEYLTTVLERVQSLPNVIAAGMVNRLPLSGNNQMAFLEFDRTSGEGRLQASRVVTAGYFRTMGIPLVEGRLFDERDTADAPGVALIDEQLAKQLWPDQSAVGQRVRFAARGTLRQASPWLDIVGVVGQVKHEGLDRNSTGHVYWHYLQNTQDRAALVVRAVDSPAIVAPVISRIRELDSEQAVYDVRTLEEVRDRSVGGRWLSMVLVGAFASMSRLLCCVGVYGGMAFGVSRQRREFGIRIALGATRRAVAGAVIDHGLRLAALGIFIGLVIAAAVTRSMQAFLYGVGASDLVSFGIATGAVVVIALLASYLPARSAASVDPAITLRAE